MCVWEPGGHTWCGFKSHILWHFWPHYFSECTDCKFVRYIHMVYPNTRPWKILEKRERGRMQVLPKFFEYPLLSQERKWSVGVFRDCPSFLSTPIISETGKVTNFKLGRYIHRVHPNKSPLKFWEKMERGRIQWLPKFFEYPLLSQERVKLRTSTFVRTVLVSIGTKVHYKFREKLASASQDSRIFQGTYILGASRGRLFDSSAVLFTTWFINKQTHHSVITNLVFNKYPHVTIA